MPGCRRVPTTDGTSPELSDVDEIHKALCSAGRDACFVFNCQQGKGRTTVGMVLALLFLAASMRSAMSRTTVGLEANKPRCCLLYTSPSPRD